MSASLILNYLFLFTGRRQPSRITVEYHVRTQSSTPSDGYEAIPSTDVSSSSHSESLVESEVGYEFQTRAAFFKGSVGALLDTSSAEVDLESVIIHPEDLVEEEEEHRSIVVSSSQIMIRNDRRSTVLENPHVTADDERENSPAISESTGQPISRDDRRESTPQKVQVVIEVPSGVVMENPGAIEEERDTTSPSSQVIVDDLEGVIVENLCAEREADDTAPQMPTIEGAEEQGCVIVGNPDAQAEGSDAMLPTRQHSGSMVEERSHLADQVLMHD